MSQLNQRKQAYDTAQKLGEAVEVMSDSTGWRDYFIPKMEEKRKESQEAINKKGVEQREADHARGIIELADYILGYEEEKKKQALTIMRNTSNAKLS